jgi:hypothetical protein
MTIVHEGRTNSFRIPILSVCIVSVNYYSYCTDYAGNLCTRELFWFDQETAILIVTLGLTVSVVAPTMIYAFFAKARKDALELQSIKKEGGDSDALIYHENSSEDEGVSLSNKKNR